MYEQMRRIRAFEEQVNELYRGAKMPGLAHLYIGEEAVAVGVCAALTAATTTSRQHAPRPRPLPREGRRRSSGCSASCSARRRATAAARAARCTSPTTSNGNLGANAIVGGSAGIATGAAFSREAPRHRPGRRLLLRRGRARPGPALRGDEHGRRSGSCRSSTSARTTSTTSTRTTRRRPPATIPARADGVRHPGRGGRRPGRRRGLRGDDARGRARARAATGPAFLLCDDLPLPRPPRRRRRPRLLPVEGGGGALGRPSATRSSCSPTRLVADGVDDGDARASRERVEAEVAAAVAYALEAPYPDPSEVTEACLRLASSAPTGPERARSDARAGRQRGARRGAAPRPDRLRDRRGRRRGRARRSRCCPGSSRSSARSASSTRRSPRPGITGLGLGAAMTGMRPVVDIMFGDFLTLIMDQVVEPGGEDPLHVGRQAEGAADRSGRRSARRAARPPSTRQSLHAWVAHVPGLKVALPSTPYDAKGLLKSAIRDDNPVVFFEDKMMFATQGAGAGGASTLVPLGVADVKREGEDVTIDRDELDGATSRSRRPSCSTSEGVSAEVVDPRTLVPLDRETLVASVAQDRARDRGRRGPPRATAPRPSSPPSSPRRRSGISTLRCGAWARWTSRSRSRRCSRTRRCRRRSGSVEVAKALGREEA